MEPKPKPVPKAWPNSDIIVAAPGPSLPNALARVQNALNENPNLRVIAVQDAYRIMPFATVLYGCDAKWWKLVHGATDFAGWKWASHRNVTGLDFERLMLDIRKEGDRKHAPAQRDNDEKRHIAALYGDINLVLGHELNIFSTDQTKIHYGSNSGFQGINLAILLGATRIGLVGFDMRKIQDKAHYFDRPVLSTGNYEAFVGEFESAAKRMPPGVEIINCTPGSALNCWENRGLDGIDDFAGRGQANLSVVDYNG